MISQTIVHIIYEDKEPETVYLQNGDAMIVESPGGIIVKGKYAVMKHRLNKANKQKEVLAELLESAMRVRTEKALEEATSKELIDELERRMVPV